MIITVYDYANNTKEITLPDKEIAEILVKVLSGDETGFVKFIDGTTIRFDASDNRITDYYDGDYTLKGKNIKKWIDFKTSGNRTVSYERQNVFYMEDEDGDTVFEDIKTGLKQAIAFEKNNLTYGVVKELDNDNVLWYEPITDEIDGFVLRDGDGSIVRTWK